MSEKNKGQCLCGGVTFTGTGKFNGVELCHCAYCRTHGAGPFMSGRFEALEIKDNTLAWYKSSEWGERGFCSTCGSTLFWRMQGETNAAVNVHALKSVSDLHIHEHIFTDSQPDWYSFKDSAPRLTAEQVIARAKAAGHFNDE